jgi:hypothetical protein
MNFQVITDHDRSQFEAKVNQAITSKLWVLHGALLTNVVEMVQPQIGTHKVQTIVYTQAFVAATGPNKNVAS